MLKSAEKRLIGVMHPLYSKIARALALAISLLAAISASLGIFNPNIYSELVKKELLSQNLYYGSIAQDMIMLPFSIVLLGLSLYSLKKPSYKVLIAIMGIVWCEFYAFGLYVIGGEYTDLYFLYLLIFGLSTYSLIFGMVSFKDIGTYDVKLPKHLNRLIKAFLSLILLLMVPLWIARIMPNIMANSPSETYAVFILDLGIVFPAIAIITMLLFKNKALGKVLAGVALMKIFALCLSWSFGELYVPLIGHTKVAIEMVGLASFFTIASAALLIPYFIHLKIGEQK